MNREFGGRRVQTFGTGGPVIWMVCDFDLAAQASALLPEGAATVAAVEGVDWNRKLTPWPAPPVARGQPEFGGGADTLLGELAGRILPEVEAELRPSARWIAGYSLAGLFAVYAALSTRLFARVASVSGSMWYPGFSDWIAAGAHSSKEGVAARGVRLEMPSATDAPAVSTEDSSSVAQPAMSSTADVPAALPEDSLAVVQPAVSSTADVPAASPTDSLDVALSARPLALDVPTAESGRGAMRAQFLPERAYFSVGDRERFGRNPAFRTVEDDARRIAAALDACGVRTRFETRPGGHFCDPAGRIARAVRWLLDVEE